VGKIVEERGYWDNKACIQAVNELEATNKDKSAQDQFPAFRLGNVSAQNSQLKRGTRQPYISPD
jgi:hypothetical protein